MIKYFNIGLWFQRLLVILLISFISIIYLKSQEKSNKPNQDLLARTAKYDPLNLFLGKWRILFVSYEHNVMAGQGEGTETINFFDGGRFLIVDIQFDKKLMGLKRHGIMSYNPESEKYTYFFIDEGGTFPVQLEGDYLEKEKTFIFIGKVFDYSLHRRRDMKLVYKFENDEKFTETRSWTDGKKPEKFIDVSHLKSE